MHSLWCKKKKWRYRKKYPPSLDSNLYFGLHLQHVGASPYTYHHLSYTPKNLYISIFTHGKKWKSKCLCIYYHHQTPPHPQRIPTKESDSPAPQKNLCFLVWYELRKWSSAKPIFFHWNWLLRMSTSVSGDWCRHQFLFFLMRSRINQI